MNGMCQHINRNSNRHFKIKTAPKQKKNIGDPILFDYFYLKYLESYFGKLRTPMDQ